MKKSPLLDRTRAGFVPNHARATLWLLAPLLALAASPVFATTNNFNAELLGRTGAISEGVWGWHDNGRSYALVAVKTALSVVDVSDPGNPVEVATVPSLGTELRAVRTYQNYALAFNQIGPIQIIDLDVPPESIRTVATFESATITGAHNVQVEGDYLYMSLWGVLPADFRILDISDPLNMVEVGFYRHPLMEPLSAIEPLLDIDHSDHKSEVGLCTIPLFELERHHCCYAGGEGVAIMAHDCIVRGDTAYVAYGGGGWVALDITDRANPQELAIVVYPDPVSHSMALTPDGKYLLHADEKPGGHMSVWDIQDLSNVREMTFFETDPEHMIHNIYVDGDLAFLAYYTEGLRVVDITNPLEPIEVAFYDQHGGPEGSYFEGAFGAYPYTPDGRVYVTDVKKGLHIFDVDRSVRGGLVLGNINEMGTWVGLDSTVVEFLEIGKSTLSDNTGFYRMGLPEGTHTMVTHHYGHLPDTSQINVYPGGITAEQRVLVPSAFGPLRIEVRNASDERLLERAALTIEGLPGGVRYSDDEGVIDWGMVPSGTYTGLLARWGSEATTVEIEVPRAHPDFAITKIVHLNLGFEDFSNYDQGWHLSASDDDASDGFWVRDDPSASWSSFPRRRRARLGREHDPRRARLPHGFSAARPDSVAARRRRRQGDATLAALRPARGGRPALPLPALVQQRHLEQPRRGPVRRGDLQRRRTDLGHHGRAVSVLAPVDEDHAARLGLRGSHRGDAGALRRLRLRRRLRRRGRHRQARGHARYDRGRRRRPAGSPLCAWGSQPQPRPGPECGVPLLAPDEDGQLPRRSHRRSRATRRDALPGLSRCRGLHGGSAYERYGHALGGRIVLGALGGGWPRGGREARCAG